MHKGIQPESNIPNKSGNTNSSMDTTLKAESILLEEFKQASVTANQIKVEVASLFNIYLIAGSIVASSILALGTLFATNYIYFTAEGRVVIGGAHYYTLILSIILLLCGTISITFFARFVHLNQEYLESISIMNEINEFYIQRLKQELPNIEQVLHRVQPSRNHKSVPYVIRYTVSLAGSLCLGYAFFSLWGIIVKDVFWLNRLQEILSLMVIAISILGQWLYYRKATAESE